MIMGERYNLSRERPERSWSGLHLGLSGLCNVALDRYLAPKGILVCLGPYHRSGMPLRRRRASEWIRILAGSLAISAMTALLCRCNAPLVPAIALVVGASLTLAGLAAIAGSSPAFFRNVVTHHVSGPPDKLEADRDFAIREEDQAAIAQFRASVGVVFGQLAANADRIALASDQLNGMVDESTQSSELAMESARTSSQSTHSVDIASQSLAVSIKTMESQVLSIRGTVRDAAHTTEETARTIEGLNTAANEIGEFVGLIQSIAAQTNLLALNATSKPQGRAMLERASPL
jgi:hypothetical protein